MDIQRVNSVLERAILALQTSETEALWEFSVPSPADVARRTGMPMPAYKPPTPGTMHAKTGMPLTKKKPGRKAAPKKECTVDFWLAFLRHKLTRWDMAQSKRERTPNVYRFGHLLGAAEKVEKDLRGKGHRADGMAFAELLFSLGNRFERGFPPVVAVKKALASYEKTGRRPKLGGGTVKPRSTKTAKVGGAPKRAILSFQSEEIDQLWERAAFKLPTPKQMAKKYGMALTPRPDDVMAPVKKALNPLVAGSGKLTDPNRTPEYGATVGALNAAIEDAVRMTPADRKELLLDLKDWVGVVRAHAKRLDQAMNSYRNVTVSDRDVMDARAIRNMVVKAVKVISSYKGGGFMKGAKKREVKKPDASAFSSRMMKGWKAQKIKLKTKEGKKEVEAEVLGVWAVHQKGMGYGITHVPSGLLAKRGVWRLDLARNAVKELVTKYPELMDEKSVSVITKRARDIEPVLRKAR